MVTFVNAQGETSGGTEATITVASLQIAWSNIPLGPAGTTARKLYRTVAGGATNAEKLVTTLNDNTTTVFTDNVTDGALGATVPATNTADDAQTADSAGTTLYFKTVDTDASGGSVVHSVAGTNYSWIKQLKWYVLTAPIHSVSNLKFYWTGAAVSLIDVKSKVSLTWTDPTATGQAATALTGVTSMYTYTAAAPLTIDGTFVVGTDTAPKFVGGFLQLQLSVGNAAIANNIVLGSLIGRYDEA